MGDVYGAVKVAAVQAASVFLDREGSTEKACRLIREAGQQRRPRDRLPGRLHPGASGLVPPPFRDRRDLQPARHRAVQELGRDSRPGDRSARRRRARRQRLCRGRRLREDARTPSGPCSTRQIYFGPDGTLIGKHQKIMPTVGERLVHMGGFGDTFGAFQTEFGPMSALICGENSNPLAVFALTAEGTRIHVMSWPNHFPISGDPLRNRVAIDAQAFAQMSKAFVISACGTVDERMIEMLKAGPEAREIPARSRLLRRHLHRRAQQPHHRRPDGRGGRHPLCRLQSRARHPDEAAARLRRPLQPAGHFPSAHQPRGAAALFRARRGAARCRARSTPALEGPRNLLESPGSKGQE